MNFRNGETRGGESGRASFSVGRLSFHKRLHAHKLSNKEEADCCFSGAPIPFISCLLAFLDRIFYEQSAKKFL
ncbi:unnamed protein product [Victoria cruziana]